MSSEKLRSSYFMALKTKTSRTNFDNFQRKPGRVLTAKLNLEYF